MDKLKELGRDMGFGIVKLSNKFKGENEALLLSEFTAILEWIRDTVKVDAGGHIPLGICTVNTTNIAANFTTGDMVGMALGIRIEYDSSVALNGRVFTDSDGTEVSTYP